MNIRMRKISEAQSRYTESECWNKNNTHNPAGEQILRWNKMNEFRFFLFQFSRSISVYLSSICIFFFIFIATLSLSALLCLSCTFDSCLYSVAAFFLTQNLWIMFWGCNCDRTKWISGGSAVFVHSIQKR